MARFSRVAPEVLVVLSASVLLLCGCDTPNGPGPIETPVVQSISPDFGPTTGGTEVTIRGLRFADGATVTIGGRLATAVTVQSAGVIVARTPPASAAGSVTVVVATAAGSGSLVGGFRYESLVNLPPVIETMTVTGPR